MFRLLKQTYYNTKNGIANLIKWFPIIWKQRDWDYGYLINIIDFKLGLMAKTIKKQAIIDAHKRVAKQLEYARFLLKRAYLDCALEAEFEEHYKKYPLDFKKLTKEVPYAPGEQEAFFELVHKEDAFKKDARKRLAKHIDKYLLGWWD